MSKMSSLVVLTIYCTSCSNISGCTTIVENGVNMGPFQEWQSQLGKLMLNYEICCVCFLIFHPHPTVLMSERFDISATNQL